MVGAKLVFPGAALDGASLYELFETEKVTFTAGVPTVWLALLQLHAGQQAASSRRVKSHGDRRLGRARRR